MTNTVLCITMQTDNSVDNKNANFVKLLQNSIGDLGRTIEISQIDNMTTAGILVADDNINIAGEENLSGSSSVHAPAKWQNQIHHNRGRGGGRARGGNKGGGRGRGGGYGSQRGRGHASGRANRGLRQGRGRRSQSINNMAQLDNQWANLARQTPILNTGLISIPHVDPETLDETRQDIQDFWKDKHAETRLRFGYGVGGIYGQPEKSDAKSLNDYSRPTQQASTLYQQTQATSQPSIHKDPDLLIGEVPSFTTADGEHSGGFEGTGACAPGDLLQLPMDLITISNNSEASRARSESVDSVDSVEKFLRGGIEGTGDLSHRGELARGGALFRPILTDFHESLKRSSGKAETKSTGL